MVRLLVGDGVVGFYSDRVLRVESTVPVYPREPRGVAVVEVSEGIDVRDLRVLYEIVSRERGLRGFHLLYTAARLPSHAGIEVVDGEGLLVMVTLGHRPVACARMRGAGYEPLTGTINVVVYTEEPLSRWAMLDLMRVAVEAKTAAVNELLPWCETRPFGTVTDAVAIARPEGPSYYATSGVLTRLGGLVADAVESLVLRLWRSMLSPEERVAETLGPYASSEIVERAAKNPGLLALLLAARHLDLHVGHGSLPERLPTPEALAEAARRLGEFREHEANHLETLLRALGVGDEGLRGDGGG